MRPDIEGEDSKAFEEAYHYWSEVNHFLDNVDLLKAWEMDEAEFRRKNLDLNDKTGNYQHYNIVESFFSQTRPRVSAHQDLLSELQLTLAPYLIKVRRICLMKSELRAEIASFYTVFNSNSSGCFQFYAPRIYNAIARAQLLYHSEQTAPAHDLAEKPVTDKTFDCLKPRDPNALANIFTQLPEPLSLKMLNPSRLSKNSSIFYGSALVELKKVLKSLDLRSGMFYGSNANDLDKIIKAFDSFAKSEFNSILGIQAHVSYSDFLDVALKSTYKILVISKNQNITLNNRSVLAETFYLESDPSEPIFTVIAADNDISTLAEALKKEFLKIIVRQIIPLEQNALANEFKRAITEDLIGLQEILEADLPAIELLDQDPYPGQKKAIEEGRLIVIIRSFPREPDGLTYRLGFGQIMSGLKKYFEVELQREDPAQHSLIKQLNKFERADFGNGALDRGDIELIQDSLIDVLLSLKGQAFRRIAPINPNLIEAYKQLNDPNSLLEDRSTRIEKFISTLLEWEGECGLAEQLAPKTWGRFLEYATKVEPQIKPEPQVPRNKEPLQITWKGDPDNLFEQVIYVIKKGSVRMNWGYRPPSENELKDFSLYAQELEDLEALYQVISQMENSPSGDLRRIYQAFVDMVENQDYKIFVQRDLKKAVTIFSRSRSKARYSIIPWDSNIECFRLDILHEMIEALFRPLFDSYNFSKKIRLHMKISGDLELLREKVGLPKKNLKDMLGEREYKAYCENVKRAAGENIPIEEEPLDIRLYFQIPKISSLSNKHKIYLIKFQRVYSVFFSKGGRYTELVLDPSYPAQKKLIQFMDEFKLDEGEIQIYLECGEAMPELLRNSDIFRIQKPLLQIIRNAGGEGFTLLNKKPNPKFEEAFDKLNFVRNLSIRKDFSSFFINHYTTLMNLEFTYPNCAIKFSPQVAKAMRKKLLFRSGMTPASEKPRTKEPLQITWKSDPENPPPQSSAHLRSSEPSRIIKAPLFRSLEQGSPLPANLKIKGLSGEEISKMGFRVEKPVRLIYAISEFGRVIISHQWSDPFTPSFQEAQQFSGMDATPLLPTKFNGEPCLYFGNGSERYYFNADTLELFAKSILLKHHHLTEKFISAGYLYISNGCISGNDPSGRNGIRNQSPRNYLSTGCDYQNEIITTLFEQHGLTVREGSIRREASARLVICDRDHKFCLPELPKSSSNMRLLETSSPQKLMQGCNYRALNYPTFQTFESLGLKIYVENSAAQSAIKQALSDAASRGCPAKSVENLFWLARHATENGNLKIFGLDVQSITPTIGSITWYLGYEIREIRLSTQEATWVMRELVHESAHATLELCNPHRGNTSEWRLVHEKNIIEACAQDVADFRTPQTLTAAEIEVADMIFEKPNQYSAQEQTAERIASVLHCLASQEDIVLRVAPRLSVAVQEYVAAEIKLPILKRASKFAAVSASQQTQNSMHLRAAEPSFEEILDAITVSYRNSDLPGVTVHHGTLISRVESVISGPLNLGWGFGGKGLYLSINEENLAVDYAGHALQSAGSRAQFEKPVLLEGILNPHKEYRVARIQITRGNGNLEKGLFPADWATKIPGLQDFMLTHFDMIEVCGAANANTAISSNRYLIIHESAAPDVVKWTNQIPLSNREIQLGHREAPSVKQQLPSSPVPQVAASASSAIGALPIPSVNSPSGTLPPATPPPQVSASAAAQPRSLAPREIVRTIQLNDVPIQGETGTLKVKIAAVRNANGTVQNPRVVWYQFKPDLASRILRGLPDIGAGLAGAATGFNIAVYYNESKQRNPELSNWEHGFAAVGITGAQGGIWCTLGGIGGAYLTIPLGVLAFAGGAPDVIEASKMAWKKVDPNQPQQTPAQGALNTLVFGNSRGVSPENLAQMTLPEVWALTPESMEYAGYQKMGRPIHDFFQWIGDAYFELRDSGLPNMHGFHPESSVFIPQAKAPAFHPPIESSEELSRPFDDLLQQRIQLEIWGEPSDSPLPEDEDGNILFRDQDGELRPAHELSQRRNYPGLGDSSRKVSPLYPPTRWNHFDFIRRGQLQLSFQNFDRVMVSVSFATSWKTAGISLVVLGVWKAFLFFKHKSEKSKHEERKRNTKRVNMQCDYAEDEVNKTIDACQAASDAFALYQAETNPAAREILRLEFIKSLEHAESLNTTYQTLNHNRVYGDVKMPTGKHEHNVRHRTKSHIRDELMPVFAENNQYFAELRQQIPFETLRGNLLTHTSTSSDLLDKKGIDYQKGLLSKDEFIAAVDAHKTEAKNIQNEALVLRQQNPDDKNVDQLVTSIENLIQEELKTSPTFLQTTFMGRELFVMATALSLGKMSDADRKNFLDSGKEFKEQWDLLTDKKGNINYLQQFADFSLRAGEYSTVQAEALALLALDGNNFHAYKLWIGASLSQETPQAEILAKISEAQSKFVEPKQQGILGYFEGVTKNDVSLVINAFNQLKTTTGPDVPGILLSCIDEIKRNALGRYQNDQITKQEYIDLMTQLAPDLEIPLEKINDLSSENQDNPELLAVLTKMRTDVELAKQQFPESVKQDILHHQSTVMVTSLNSIQHLLKKVILSEEEKASIRAELLKFSKLWNEFDDQINHLNWLEIHADFAMHFDHYAIAQQDALELLEKAPTLFHGAELWIESSKKLKLTDADILCEIEKFKARFLGPNELGRLCFQRGLITKAPEDFQEAFGLLKQNFSIENSKMLQICFDQFERQDSEKRVMDVEFSREISEDSMLLPQRSVTLEFLLKSLGALRAEKEKLSQLKEGEETYDFAQRRLAQLDTEIKKCENDIQYHARTSKSDRSSIENQSARQALQSAGLAHLAFEVFAALEGDVQLANYCGLKEPQMHAQNWRQIGNGIFNCAKKRYSDQVERLGAVGAEKFLTNFQVRTPDHMADLQKALAEVKPENTNALRIFFENTLSNSMLAERFNALKIFFDNKFGNLISFKNNLANFMLGARLVEALVNYGLQMAYLHSKEERTYEEWTRISWVAWGNSFLSLGLDTAASLETINELVLVAMAPTVNPLDFVLVIMNTVLQTPLLSKIILDNIEADQRCSESQLRIILGAYIQTMNMDLFHKFSGTHSSPILKILYSCIGDSLASKLVQHAASLTGVLRLANCSLRLVVTLGDTAPAALKKRQLHNATLEWRQELDEAKKYLERTTEKPSRQRLLAQHIFDRIKNTIEALSDRHRTLPSLYAEALFLRHQCDDQIKIGNAPRDGNGLFFAVSQYTKETPAELRKMSVNYIEENEDYFRNFIEYPMKIYLFLLAKPGVPTDALVIHALSAVLRRPIVLAFLREKATLDFNSQGLRQPSDFPTGAPIYVAYHPQREEYSPCWVGSRDRSLALFPAVEAKKVEGRNISLDLQIQQREESLRKKGILIPKSTGVEPTKSDAELQRENAELNNKIKSLQLRLLGKGLKLKIQDPKNSQVQSNLMTKIQ